MADAAFSALLTDTVSIYRRSTSGSADEWGAIPESVAASSTGVPCLVQQMEETIEFTRRGKKIQTRLCVFFEITADIKEDDMIEFEGKRYEVISVEDAGGQGHHLEVYVWNLEN